MTGSELTRAGQPSSESLAPAAADDPRAAGGLLDLLFAGHPMREALGAIERDAASPSGAALEALVRHLETLRGAAPDALLDHRVVASARDAIMTATAAADPTTARASASAVQGPDPLPRSLRRAIAFLERNAATTVTIDDVARAARMSPRGLQQLFRRELDATPLEHHRRLRLERVRAALAGADPISSTVAGIAGRFGFRQLGRFAQQYRAAFGETPSATLRR